jgi:hypothetical protein
MYAQLPRRKSHTGMYIRSGRGGFDGKGRLESRSFLLSLLPKGHFIAEIILELCALSAVSFCSEVITIFAASSYGTAPRLCKAISSSATEVIRAAMRKNAASEGLAARSLVSLGPIGSMEPGPVA